jgi:hypothetical protein
VDFTKRDKKEKKRKRKKEKWKLHVTFCGFLRFFLHLRNEIGYRKVDLKSHNYVLVYFTLN